MSKGKKLVIGGREFGSRLFVGTGKYSSNDVMKKALEASGTEMVTVALRRVDFNNKENNILSYIDREKYVLLPNTSGAQDAEQAIRIAKMARAAGCGDWIKIEVIPDPRYLLPDPVGTLQAAEALVKEGFIVLPYINADPVLANRLQDVGVAAVMPLGAPIGTNKGITTKEQIAIIIEQATVPVVVDAGIGTPSHAAEAIEMGADAVLVNTAIAVSGDPIKMAEAFKYGVHGAELAVAAGLAGKKLIASASSPLTGFLK